MPLSPESTPSLPQCPMKILTWQRWARFFSRRSTWTPRRTSLEFLTRSWRRWWQALRGACRYRGRWCSWSVAVRSWWGYTVLPTLMTSWWAWSSSWAACQRPAWSWPSCISFKLSARAPSMTNCYSSILITWQPFSRLALMMPIMRSRWQLSRLLLFSWLLSLMRRRLKNLRKCSIFSSLRRSSWSSSTRNRVWPPYKVWTSWSRLILSSSSRFSPTCSWSMLK